MSLRFFFGPSGSGKSTKLYKEIVERAKDHPRQNFVVLVPDQFTMQTQKELVSLNERGGILNIDVLSFDRLTYRVLDETGELDTPVLDDTGKSLVLEKVALSMKEDLPTLGSHLNGQGYIHEVKSIISEFMEYGIKPEDVDELISYSSGKGALVHKLTDLKKLYQEFRDYIRGDFVTREETLEVLCRNLEKSELIRGSVVVIDGFTGFTPIQNKVIRELMCLCTEVTVCLTLGAGEDPYAADGEQKLFYLTKKTVKTLTDLAKEAKVPRGEDVWVLPSGHDRFADSPAMRSLEEKLFRTGAKPFCGEQESIRLMEMSGPGQEIHQVGLKILELVRGEEKMAYRDIAVIAADLEGYAPFVETEFAALGIPYYIDRTKGIVLNPMTEYVNSALELFIHNFSYDAVFHYMRSGLCDLSEDETDRLENYVIAAGIRGYSVWKHPFTKKSRDTGDDADRLSALNRSREKFLEQIGPLAGMKNTQSVEGYVNMLYDFLVQNRVQEKLAQMEEMFKQNGDQVRSGEYAQIYRLVMDLLDQVYELLGGEIISLTEFSQILEAGFAEIQVGTIPQNVDHVLVGDMERTRSGQVKALYFVGVNDGNIPRSSSKGGIISDMDREFLRGSGLELAPSPREQMFIQRFYLYLNMTKPSRVLYLSWSKTDASGKSLRPAYLIDTVRGYFPSLSVEYPEKRSVSEMVVTPGEGEDYLADEMREYVEGTIGGDVEETELFTLYEAYGENDDLRKRRERITDAAFARYEEKRLTDAVSRALYGTHPENSISRLETYAGCAYEHFLKYGLTLQEREEFGFENVDMGNVFHAVLEEFACRLSKSEYTWFDFPDEYASESVSEALEICAASYRESVLSSSARNEYAVKRMNRLLKRSVLTMREQLKRGRFTPKAYEFPFHYETDGIQLNGRIDRLDTACDDDHVYVKVIDYKSGKRKFDLAAVYYGQQLQLMVYMNAALSMERKKHPDREIVPAACLYYHIDDPAVESAHELTGEEMEEAIMEQLRLRGVINSSGEVVDMLDETLKDCGDGKVKSMVIPIERKKDGSLSASCDLFTGEEMAVVSDYVNCKVEDIAKEIAEGRTDKRPFEDACTYCPYFGVCGFDPAIPGYEKQVIPPMGKEEVLKKMRERTGKEEK